MNRYVVVCSHGILNLSAENGTEAAERAENLRRCAGIGLAVGAALAVFTEAEWGRGTRRLFEGIAVIVDAVPNFPTTESRKQ